MGRHIRNALVVAGVVLIGALIYIDLPSAPGQEVSEQSSSEENNVATSTVQTNPTVELKGQTIQVTIAETPEERGRGLSGRAGLAEDEGMLFVFSEDGRYSFWMKDMLFSIDIIWIAKDGTIVDIARNISPDTYPTSFAPKAPARYVLELKAGWLDENGVAIGDVVGL